MFNVQHPLGMNAPKNNNYIISFAFLLLFTGCYSVVHPPQGEEKISTVEELDSYLQNRVDAAIPPGLSLVVIKDGKIVYNKAFGWADRPNKIKAAPETVYHWWSCTKIATAIAIMQLREKGMLKLDDPVTKYLPWFRVEYPSDTCREITILNLLNHSSGVAEAGMDLITWIHHESTPPFNQTSMIRTIFPRYSKLIFAPGDHSEYTNIGYMVLGAVIEKISGLTYEDYIRKNILVPLKMYRTDFVYTESMRDNEAAGAHPLYDAMTPILLLMVPTFINNVDNNHVWFKRVYTDQTPPTALIGPATDAARLLLAYSNGGELDGERILSDSSVNSMNTEGYIKLANDDPKLFRRQGIGWRIFRDTGELMIKHEGGGPGFTTIMQLYPDKKLGFVLFTNDVRSECWRIINAASYINW